MNEGKEELDLQCSIREPVYPDYVLTSGNVVRASMPLELYASPH